MGDMTMKAAASVFAMCLALLADPVEASFHFMKVVQVFPGTAAAPNAQYVMIQMYAGGQNQVSGHQISVFNASGSAVQNFTFNAAVAKIGRAHV